MSLSAPLERYVEDDRGYLTLCWIWQGAPDGSNGYGRLRVGSGKRTPAHRFFYEHHRGPVPDGLGLDHLCCVSLCVNPDHLEPVTGTENNRRRRWNKLTAESAAELRHRYADELGVRKHLPVGVLQVLADEFGCSKQAVMHAARGRTWL